MASLTRLLSLQVASGDSLDVRHCEITEQMSRLFKVSLLVRSPNPDVDLDAIVGYPASFTVAFGTDLPKTRTWSGVVTSLKQTAVEEAGLSTYQIEIAPPLWLLTQRRRNRIFQRLSELSIVEKVLGEWAIPFDRRISSEHKKRKYRVEYTEADFAFVSRMLEDAGISYYFDPASGDSKLVLSDAPQAGAPRPPIGFLDAPTDWDREFVTAVNVGRRVRPGRYTLRDQDYRQPPTYRLMQSAKGGTSPEEGLERYHYVPGSFLFESEKGGGTPVADDKGKYRADEGMGADVAQKRLDAQRATAKTVTFRTNALDLGPGVVMSILDHPKSELSGGRKLLVTAMTFTATPGGEWVQTCEAVSADAPYAPELSTPKPKVQGIETATVVGPPGEQIHVDEFGRVRVQFHWDLEGSMDDSSSCWIPVSHSWAGGGFGHVNLPRVGHEVIVDFLAGDPDRPIVVGRVYTNVTKVPYPLPALKTQSGWKSQTVGGTGYNEIMFEDAPGKELVRMQAEKDLTKLVKHDETVTIGNDRTKNVANNDSLTVGNDRTHTVGNNESIQVGNCQTILIGVNQSITVGADQSITLPSGNQTESITGNRTFTLTGDLTETITGNSSLTQTGNITETITGNSSLTQTGNQSETVTGSWTRTQTGEQSETLVGGHSLLQIGGQSEVQIGGRTTFQVGERTDVHIGGRKDIQLGGKLEVQVGGTTRVEIGALNDSVVGARTESTSAASTETVGAMKSIQAGDFKTDAGSITMTAICVLEAKGGAIKVEATGETSIKGSIIRLN